LIHALNPSAIGAHALKYKKKRAPRLQKKQKQKQKTKNNKSSTMALGSLKIPSQLATTARTKEVVAKGIKPEFLGVPLVKRTRYRKGNKPEGSHNSQFFLFRNFSLDAPASVKLQASRFSQFTRRNKPHQK